MLWQKMQSLPRGTQSSQRGRKVERWNGKVSAYRQQFDLHEALCRFGCSPGERTCIDDWTVWHGFEFDGKKIRMVDLVWRRRQNTDVAAEDLKNGRRF